MKKFYNQTKSTFYPLYEDYIEIRTYHSFFWGFVNITTKKKFLNETA